MINLTPEKIKDFKSCELLYKYRHVDDELEPIYSRQMTLERFQEEMKKLFTFFFYKKQGGGTPSYTALINRWERTWFDSDTTADDITSASTTPGAVSDINLTTRAATILMNFHNDFNTTPTQPVIVDELLDYSLSPEIKLSSQIDIALRNPENKTILILKWTFMERSKGVQDHGIEFAMIDYVLRNKSALAEDHKFIYGTYEVSAKSNEIKPFMLEPKHTNAMHFWLEKIGQTGIFAPRRGLSTACKGCNFDDQCFTFNEYFGADSEG